MSTVPDQIPAKKPPTPPHDQEQTNLLFQRLLS